MPTVDTGFNWRWPSVLMIVALGASLRLNDFPSFPVLAGQNGDGGFLLLYLLLLVIIFAGFGII